MAIGTYQRAKQVARRDGGVGLQFGGKPVQIEVLPKGRSPASIGSESPWLT